MDMSIGLKRVNISVLIYILHVIEKQLYPCDRFLMHVMRETDYAICIGLDNKSLSIKMLIFSYLLVLTYVLCAQKNSLIETVLLSTHNISFI